MIVSPPDLIVKELLALAEERIVKLEQEAERWNQPSRVIDTLVRFLLDTQIADPKWAAPMTRAIYTALNNAWPKP